jgi:hypothetical protein
VVVNNFGLRATDPAELSKVEDPLGVTPALLVEFGFKAARR